MGTRPSPLGSVARARGRTLLALLVALASDALAIAVELVPPLQLALDLGTALVLLALLGFRWALVPAFVLEALPGVGVFPSWSLAVGALAALAARPGVAPAEPSPPPAPASRTDRDPDRT